MALCLFFLSGFIACSHIEKELSEFISFSSEGMIKNKWYDFSFDLSEKYNQIEPSSFYDISIEVRYSGLFKYKNLPIVIECYNCTTDTINQYKVDIPLFDSGGEAVVKSKYGIFETQYKLENKVKLDSCVSYSLTTPLDNSEGIINLGLLIKEHL